MREEISGRIASVPAKIRTKNLWNTSQNGNVPVEQKMKWLNPDGIQLNNELFFNLCSGTLGTAATTGLLYQPRMIGDGDYG
jgi:hypothetical protein